MRRTWMAIPAVAAAVTLAGCGSDNNTHMTASNAGSHLNGGSSMPMSGSTSATGQRSPADVMFAGMMIPHHQQAIEMANLAASRAASPQVKSLAAGIAAAQAPEIATMRGWLTSWGAPMMGGTTGTSGGMAGGMMSTANMTELKNLSGKAFDRAFLTMMTAHHRGAIQMARTEQANGRYGPAKTMAGNIVRTQTEEIATMADLLRSS